VRLDVFAAPPQDCYQIITEHPVGHITAEDTGLGLDRSAGVMVVQIFQQGRSEAEKKALYAELAQQSAQQCAVRPEDLIVDHRERTRGLVIRAGPGAVPRRRRARWTCRSGWSAGPRRAARSSCSWPAPA